MGRKSLWRRWKASEGLNWNPGLALAVVVSFSPIPPSHFLSTVFCQKWIPPSSTPTLQLLSLSLSQPLSADYQQVATFEHGTGLLWSNSYKMPNKTYGPPLAGSRSLYNTMDHCYGTDDVMTALRSVLLLFTFSSREKHIIFISVCIFDDVTSLIPQRFAQISRWQSK